MEDGSLVSFEYDLRFNKVRKATDPKGTITTYEYDEHNNLIRAMDPYGKYLVTDYNVDDLPIKITDQEGKETRTEYDNEGRVTRTMDGAGNEVVYHYDETDATVVSSSLPVRIDYPTFTRKLYYNNMQRLTRAEDVLGQETLTRHFTYDSAGNVLTETDEQGSITAYEYDALNRLIRVVNQVDGQDVTVERTYDGRDNLLSVRDPNEGLTRYAYDRNNRRVSTTRPMGQETTYEYDPAGNRTAVNDPKGQRIEYEYNGINRLTRVRYYESGSQVKAVDFTYDELGNITTYDDGITSGTYTYDDLQRKIAETVDYGPFTKTVSYAYYANGLKESYTDPEGVTYTYTYDENNRPSGMDIPSQGQVTYNTYQWNSPTRMTLPGGAFTEYTYDPLMRLESILARDPGHNPQLTRQYTYSPAGNITQQDTEHGTYTYQYDDLYRLTGAVNPTLEDEAYTYDHLGNRLTAMGILGEWTYNANNEILSYATYSFGHDENGNMVQKTAGSLATLYTYDVEDRLTTVEQNDGLEIHTIAEYYYDPFGRRLWKEIDGQRRYFVYSDEGLIGEYDDTGAELRTYGYEPGSLWGTDPLFVKIGNQYYWYRNDAQGTPRKIVDTSGAVVWSAVYDSFGSCHITTEVITNNLRFAGQYYDHETGLHYNLNRYYDPKTGRYLRTDPFGEGLNLYAYVFNNPVNWIDPWGLCVARGVRDWVSSIRWDAVGEGGLAFVGGAALVYAGVGITAVGNPVFGLPIFFIGTTTAGYGVVQMTAGFMGHKLPFGGVVEGIIMIATGPGETRDKLTAMNLLLNMLITRRVPSTAIGDAVEIIQHGLTIKKSIEKIREELEKAKEKH